MLRQIKVKKGTYKNGWIHKIQLTSVKGGWTQKIQFTSVNRKHVGRNWQIRSSSCMEYHNMPFLRYFDKLTSPNFLGGAKSVMYLSR
jgi:hypothetical protein